MTDPMTTAPAEAQGAPGRPGAETSDRQAPSTSTALSILALIAGIAGAALACIPFLGALFGVVFFLIAAVLGVLALVLKRFRAKKGFAIAGVVLGVLALALGIANPFVMSAIMWNPDGQVEVEYRVSSDTASTASIYYSLSNGLPPSRGGVYDGTNLIGETLPWSMTFDVPYRRDAEGEYYTLYAQPHGSVPSTVNYTCEILIDGQVAVTSTSHSATCDIKGHLADLVP